MIPDLSVTTWALGLFFLFRIPCPSMHEEEEEEEDGKDAIGPLA